MGLTYWRICGLAVILTWLAAPGIGQVETDTLTYANAAGVSGQLQDAPSPTSDKVTFGTIFGVMPRNATGKPAKKFHLVVAPDEYGLPLSDGAKFQLAVRSRFTATSLASTLFSAGWSHIRDSDPHYGTDSGAFGERLGASALKDATQSIFTYGIVSVCFATTHDTT